MNDPEIRLVITVRCDDCEGTGTVSDPYGFGWAELVVLPNDQYEREMEERGYPLGGRNADGKFPPPEEGQCGECDGAGRRRREVTLEEFAQLLAEGDNAIARSFRAAFDAVGP